MSCSLAAGQSNLICAWILFLGGGISGAILGLFYERENWLGGYGSFRRRLLRLGHISFFGLGFVNIAYALTLKLWPGSGSAVASAFLILSGVTMPIACASAAFRSSNRVFFALPVGALLLASTLTLINLIL